MAVVHRFKENYSTDTEWLSASLKDQDVETKLLPRLMSTADSVDGLLTKKKEPIVKLKVYNTYHYEREAESEQEFITKRWLVGEEGQ